MTSPIKSALELARIAAELRFAAERHPKIRRELLGIADDVDTLARERAAELLASTGDCRDVEKRAILVKPGMRTGEI